jgi:hypothetical protein
VIPREGVESAYLTLSEMHHIAEGDPERGS